ncbi:Secreted lipase [Lachnellula suecica]|uniref:Secreted lipase n=1 Tax=Lachnellula suecica TaxID=602035 RepID=A0A8T9CLF5_9HELO|nr:Secreted lipase [Lachnellula suecica]
MPGSLQVIVGLVPGLLFLVSSSYGRIVHTPLATYVGASDGTLDIFHGIPFAEPPVGNLRLQPPQAITTKLGLLKLEQATNGRCYGIDAVQGLINGTEDCLKLDLIRPSTHHHNLPVYVLIHGGEFNNGDKSDLDGSELVKTGFAENQAFIYVSINYRVSFLGFPSGREAQSHNAFNLGLQDQRMALQWVKANIGAFGGDPSKITLGGQATGADSVVYQMMAYGGVDEGLFQSVILQSGAATGLTPIPKPDYAAWQNHYDSIVNMTGCTSAPDGFACLQSLPIDKLANAFFVVFEQAYSIPQHVYAVVVDGVWFQDYPSVLMSAGQFVAVPTVIGHTTNELINRIPTYVGFSSDASILGFTGAYVPYVPQQTVTEMLALFPASQYSDSGPPGSGSQWTRVVDIDNYLQSFCPINTAASQISSKGADVWKYRWDARHSTYTANTYLGVDQGSDLTFIYSTPSHPNPGTNEHTEQTAPMNTYHMPSQSP